ncbi:hypothetical protein FBZ99_12413 [Rhizobium sp. ERR 1071]|nr:hypothetical protein FBZ99_12413 [Rhizobium sp. ERR1071]
MAKLRKGKSVPSQNDIGVVLEAFARRIHGQAYSDVWMRAIEIAKVRNKPMHGERHGTSDVNTSAACVVPYSSISPVQYTQGFRDCFVKSLAFLCELKAGSLLFEKDDARMLLERRELTAPWVPRFSALRLQRTPISLSLRRP